MLEIKNYIQDSHRVSIEWICGELIHTHFSKTSTNKRRLAFYIAYLLYCFASLFVFQTTSEIFHKLLTVNMCVSILIFIWTCQEMAYDDLSGGVFLVRSTVTLKAKVRCCER